MIRFVVALLLLMPITALAQQELKIDGVASLPVYTEARYQVRGLNVPQGTLDEVGKWAQSLVVGVDGPEGATPSAIIEIGIVRRTPMIYFSGDKPGLYVICLVDVSDKAAAIVTKRVIVGDLPVNPQLPGPAPSTPAIPNPQVKALKATYVYEKSNDPIPGEITALFRELIRSEGFSAASVDQDVKNGNGEIPKQFTTAISKAKEFGVPSVVIEFSDGSATAVKPVASEIRKAIGK